MNIKDSDQWSCSNHRFNVIKYTTICSSFRPLNWVTYAWIRHQGLKHWCRNNSMMNDSSTMTAHLPTWNYGLGHK